ncbi:MAG: chromosome partitioning protein ParB, partial [Proteobacteria bacterium]|nr:chromosome partitioning protein ParB [Burkholderiales bacterium]
LALEAAAQIALANRIAAQRLSVRETEREVGRMNQVGRRAARATTHTADRDVARLEERLAQVLGTGVRVRPGAKQTGRLEISWHSLEHLDELTRRLGLAPE